MTEGTRVCPPWVVVYHQKPEGGGKDDDVELYAFNDESAAKVFASWLNEKEMGSVYNSGGYPGGAWVIDPTDPDAYSSTAGYAEWFAEDLAEEAVCDTVGLEGKEAEFREWHHYKAYTELAKADWVTDQITHAEEEVVDD